MKKNNSSDVYLILCALLSIVVLFFGGFIIYDKALKKENNTKSEVNSVVNCPRCQECEKCDCPKCTNSNLGEKVNSIKEIKLTHTNQEFKVGSKTYKIKLGTDDKEGQLSINDYFVHSNLSSDNVYANSAYLTDKFIFFTIAGQNHDSISYAIGEDGEIIANNNDYQMDNFKIVDGYLYAKGNIFCGLDEDCPDKDLLIKYIDNTLIVVEAK